MRLLKREFPFSKTILGISNVSFGLPPAGREVLNSVFLYHATQAGLDAAIVNTERLARYAEIPEEERRLAEALIHLPVGDKAAGEAAVAAFTAAGVRVVRLGPTVLRTSTAGVAALAVLNARLARW